jgi:hypothetical protein
MIISTDCGLMNIATGYSDAVCSRLMALPLTSNMQCLPCRIHKYNNKYINANTCDAHKVGGKNPESEARQAETEQNYTNRLTGQQLMNVSDVLTEHSHHGNCIIVTRQ